MDFYAVFAIAVALAMDAFAVSIAAGVQLPQATHRQKFRLSFHFGLFQGGMPVIGYYAGARLQDIIATFDHWVAFVLLTGIGLKMVYDALFSKEDTIEADNSGNQRDPTRGILLITLAVATSIDALIVGITFGVLGIAVWYPAGVIAVVTALFSLGGIVLGQRIGSRWGQRMEVLGGVVLCLLGTKILLEHLLG